MSGHVLPYQLFDKHVELRCHGNVPASTNEFKCLLHVFSHPEVYEYKFMSQKMLLSGVLWLPFGNLIFIIFICSEDTNSHQGGFAAFLL
jgi:hypothetical protein